MPEEGDPTDAQNREKMLPHYAHTAYLGSGGDEVSFAQGASVEVLNRSTSGWWTVRYTCMNTVMVMYSFGLNGIQWV